MFLRTRTYVYVAFLLAAASGLGGCIIDECVGHGEYEATTCGSSSLSGDDCWNYASCPDDYQYDAYEDSDPLGPTEADCDPMLVAYDECVADFGECFEPCAAFLTEHSRCLQDITLNTQCAELETGYAECVEDFGAEFQACVAFAEELEANCTSSAPQDTAACTAPEDTDTPCEPCLPCNPPEEDPCIELQLSYEQCTENYCSAHELCVTISFELEQNNC